MSRYVMSLDQGTTSCRCILFDHEGRPASVAQKEFAQIYPKAGWVEHDPMEIWSCQMGVAQEALYKIGASASDLAAIGITNQRETTVVWDKATGKPVYNAIVWQCRRTSRYCDSLRERELEEFFRSRTGLTIDAYFSATKLRWILENVPGAREKGQRGELLFGTIDTWLIWNLTKGEVHATDCTNASRTMMFNIHTLDWDEDILRELGIPRAMLPKVLPSSGVFGYTHPAIFGGSVPVAGAAGDQQAALFGQACFERGSAKNTYGTGCFLLMNTGEKPVDSKNGLLTTIAWGEGGRVEYALEGSIFVGGAVIQWLRDELRLIDSAPESEEAARQVEDTNGVYIVPAFVGLGAPYWDQYARGAVVGLTRGANRCHIVRAALESIAYQVADVLHAMEEDAGVPLCSLKVDGGASANDFLLQFQSDIIGCQVQRPACVETTALGAAYLAGLGVGFWESRRDVAASWQMDKAFSPCMGEERRQKLLAGWRKAVERSFAWAEE